LTAGALLDEPSGGGIVAVGGGALPDRIYERILRLSGRQEPHVLVLPLATSEPDVSGPKTEQRFRQCGAKRVDWMHFLRQDADKAEVADRIRAANVLYFPGGGQKRFLEAVRGTEAAKAIRDVAAKGGVVAGTSAGCEVLGDLSLTGAARLDLAVVKSSEVEPGLSLVPGVVFDQHFLRRGRFLRLLSATLDAPRKVGVGIDESTAALFPHGTRSFEVVGERQVTVFRLDERSRTVDGKAGELVRASHLRLHVLAEGDRYDLDKDSVAFGSKPVAAPAPGAPASRSAATADEPADVK
jgi:cyanophycinase